MPRPTLRHTSAEAPARAIIRRHYAGEVPRETMRRVLRLLRHTR